MGPRRSSSPQQRLFETHVSLFAASVPPFSAAVAQLCSGGRVLSLFLDDPGRHPAVRHCWSLLAEVHADLPVFSFDSDSLLDPDLSKRDPSSSSLNPNLSESEVREKIAILVARCRGGSGSDPTPEDDHSFRDAIRDHQQVLT